MATFQRVEANRAGPTALGILIPPGPRTLVILRPRALDWDLLPVAEAGAPRFGEFDRDEAASLARRVHADLAADAAAGRKRLEPLAQPAGYRLGMRLAGFVWIVCPRTPGQPYRPMVFASLKEALYAADLLGGYLCPAADANQEYYFNTQNFSRLPQERP